ncbi:MAG: bifunctional serine/threonine-protein kinase/ABC transporter substrate-binding protein [Nostoc sp. DedSLP03]|uniref:bifunctional serine/threonine-protein kinase/ABC transporter substrate-binding protein n=1 Tax=Nostoc sp. DedSLP03 TaxID=3075400 RepID=UPI002AD572B7|nr:bifunctional serine/threonine-protein kinase/ABC transporter substrate-binding protein [Nostoc sp. DedSLP03]MDZ7965551.1 bifunctional serine/threonine-protein kinase/ABC transporter substrate-binding protein [Nostoc sp. DedSLP03]
MSFCINHLCDNRENPNDIEHCNGCGTPLILSGKYRVLRALRDPSSQPGLNYEVFEIQDLKNNGELNVLKTLVRNDNPKLIELFNREIQVLSKLEEPCIPKGKHYFSIDIHTPQRRELRCLVMEFIEGMNLEERIKHNGKLTDESQALDWLKQLTKILGLIHDNGLIHRDIKPSNIMLKAKVPKDELVLIDFGTVKLYETAANFQHSTKINSIGYTSEEVKQGGELVRQSDFFALGRTFVYLLTGKHPDEFESDLRLWKWRSEFPQSELMDLINDLMKEQAADRPQSAEEILRRIQKISPKQETVDPSPPPKRKIPAWLFPLAGVGVSGFLLLVAFFILIEPQIPCWSFFKQCAPPSPNPVNNFISSGEKLLINQKFKLTGEYAQLKAEGIKEFNKAAETKDYTAAIHKFQEIREKAQQVLANKNIINKDEKNASLQALKDAEVLIYLNNSKVRNANRDNSNNIFTIAVPVPVNLDEGLHILQGVAQAQDQVNRDSPYLEVLIADDNNNQQRAIDVATALAKNEKVLAIVGHYTSEITSVAMKVYKEKGNGLVVVSPTSTSTYLSQEYGTKHIFFRTTSSTAVEGESLAGYAKLIKTKKIAVFTSSTNNETFTGSLTIQFTKSFGKYNVIGPYDLNSDSINKLELDEIKNADAIAVFPDGQNQDSPGLKNARELIKKYLKQNDNKKILGANSLFLWTTINTYLGDVKQKAVCRLIIGIDWFFVESDSKPKFDENAKSYWGGPVNFRTALANDAIQVLVEAWQQNAKSRSEIQNKLSSKDFNVQDQADYYGKIATQDRKVSFLPNGDRQEITKRILVTPVLSNSKQKELQFAEREKANCPQ